MGETALEPSPPSRDDIPAELRQVPPCPRVAQRILQIAGKDDTQTGELIRLIRRDTAFGGRVLQLANSVEFGRRQRVESLQRAVALIGHRHLRRIAVSVATAGFAQAVSGQGELQRCWTHTLACAVIAEELARCSGLDSDEAYTLALLHDLGCLAMLARFPGRYAELLRQADATGLAEDSSFLLDKEAEEFGIDHCYYGAWVSTQWGLPAEFRVAAGRHHDRPDPQVWDLQTILQLGSRLADGLGFDTVRTMRPYGFESLRADLPAAARERFWVDEEAFVDEIQRRITVQETLAGATGEPAPAPPPESAPISGGETLPAPSPPAAVPAPKSPQPSLGGWAFAALAALVLAVLAFAFFAAGG